MSVEHTKPYSVFNYSYRNLCYINVRETGIGGLAGTPTGKAIRDIVQMQG